jgi:serine/threonine protein kinase
MTPDRTATVFSSTAPGSNAPPDIVISGYSPVRELGRGGQGVVYLAVQESTSRQVAIKVMRDGPLADERQLARFDREIRILAALDHPNIVTVLDRGLTADRSRYLTMNYIDGQPLDEFLRTHSRDDGLRVFLRIADAVNAAHLRGVVHRDLKPTNIRVDLGGQPHVLDFGLARSALGTDLIDGQNPVSVAGTFVGSLPWASPEQADGATGSLDGRSDVYALGVLLYQIVSGGRFPYPVDGTLNETLTHILRTRPMPPSRAERGRGGQRAFRHRVDTIVLKALAKRPDGRYQTAGELGRDLHQLLTGGVSARRHWPLVVSGLIAGTAALSAVLLDRPKAPIQPPTEASTLTFSTGPNRVYSLSAASPVAALGWDDVNTDADLRVGFDLRTTSDRPGVLLSNRGRLQDAGIVVRLRDDGKITAVANGSEYMVPVNGGRIVNDGVWHHVQVLKRGNRLRLWVDGRYEGGVTTRVVLSSSSPWVLGTTVDAREPPVVAELKCIALARQPPPNADEADLEPIGPARPGASTIDLLPMISPAHDAVRGTWLWQGHELRCGQLGWTRLQIPYRPPPQYDLRVSFSRLTGGQAIVLILTAGGRSFTWEMGGFDDALCGFERVQGLDFASLTNPTICIDGRHWLSNRRRHTCVVRVRKNGVAAFLDGQSITQWTTDFHDISMDEKWVVAPGLLGLGSHDGSAAFDEVRLTEVGSP